MDFNEWWEKVINGIGSDSEKWHAVEIQVKAIAEQAYNFALEDQWQDIETAKKDGSIIFVGKYNELGKWRTIRSSYFTLQEMKDEDLDREDCIEGWYEVSEECDDEINCWYISPQPTHWQHLPKPPRKK